jgi:hypothetical protein
VILALAVVVAVLVALLRGGSLETLSRAPLRWGGLAIASFALQAVFIYQQPVVKVVGQWGWTEAVFVASHLLLLVAIWANRRSPGMLWIGVGLVLNLAVIVANGGWMPVTPQAISRVGFAHLVPEVVSGLRFPSSKNIVLMLEETRLALLSDILVLPRPFPVPSVFSVGDVLVAAGAILWIQSAMVGRRSRTVAATNDGGMVK